MGKEWLYWVGGGGSKKRGRSGGEERESTMSGCMSTVLQLFDLHPFQFGLHQQSSSKPDSFLPEEPTILKGIEAPRNSLELEEPFMEAASLSSSIKEEVKVNIPMCIQIKTSWNTTKACGSKARSTVDFSSECSGSPSTKTPSLVARLMGLDLLPDNIPSSPSLSSNHPSKSHLHTQVQSLKQGLLSRRSSNRYFSDDNIIGTRSLPETPRISYGRKSDVDHRLSLQINKENIDEGLEDENKSPDHYGRQIMKQVKEKVSRRAGLDITNTIKNRDQGRKDQVLLNPKRPSKGDESNPRLRFIESKNKQFTTSAIKTQISFNEEKVSHQNSIQKISKKVVFEGFNPPLKKPPRSSDTIRNKKEEPFVVTTNKAKLSEKKCKKTQSSNQFINSNVPTLFPVKKDPLPAATTKSPQHQSQVSDAHSSRKSIQLSNCSSHLYQQAEFQYISRILKRIGIHRNTPVSFTKWYSPSHPLHPSIFHHLELFHPSTTDSLLSRRCNRKLMFQLVNELLVEILKPYINSKPWVTPIKHEIQMYGSQLINILCKRIRSFPLADCRVLEDIYALIDKDFCRTKLRKSNAFEEEGEGIVLEIEREIVDKLLHETVMLIFGMT